jgi:hypothetical protein
MKNSHDGNVIILRDFVNDLVTPSHEESIFMLFVFEQWLFGSHFGMRT